MKCDYCGEAHEVVCHKKIQMDVLQLVSLLEQKVIHEPDEKDEAGINWHLRCVWGLRDALNDYFNGDGEKGGGAVMSKCPECNGTGQYVGLNKVEPCRRCKASAFKQWVADVADSDDNPLMNSAGERFRDVVHPPVGDIIDDHRDAIDRAAVVFREMYEGRLKNSDLVARK